MNPEFESHDTLKKLLALKRCEQPPPGYFDDLARRVNARLAGDASARSLPWWERFWLNLEIRPALACAYSVAISSLLLFGVGYSLSGRPEPIAVGPAPGYFTDLPGRMGETESRLLLLDGASGIAPRSQSPPPVLIAYSNHFAEPAPPADFYKGYQLNLQPAVYRTGP
ncbi:MAG TPA: hypothetical protein VMS21_00060 [Methylomirabilota bacterium]|nr:hypothetical protein [Methylomirabilota bacterium]